MVAGLVATTALLTGCTEAVVGEPSAAEAERDVAGELEQVEPSGLRETFDQSETEVNDYWTDDRMNNAQPPVPEGEGSDVPQADPLEEAVIVEPSEPATPDIPPGANGNHDGGDEWTYAGLSDSTVGRAYISFGEVDTVCSATVISSESKVLVATAAHCVWETTRDNKRLADNVLFVPGDRDGDSDHGRWVADSMFMPTEFRDQAHSSADDGSISGDGWAYDTAFLRMKPQNGERIEDALGAQGIAFSTDPNGVTVLGYPTAAPFDGSVMRYCSATSWARGAAGGYDIPCVMTPGCSGGPWLTRFDPDSGVGYLVSTSSTTTGTNLAAAFYGEVAYDTYVDADENRG